MKQVISISLAAVLCAALVFSCTSNIELPPPPLGEPSSSSSGSSSSLGISGDCPASVKDFTCSWQPSTVISGDNSKISFAYNAPAGTTCTREVWKPISEGNVNDTVYFPLDKNIKTAGRYDENEDVTLKNSGTNMTEVSVSWPRVSEAQQSTFTAIGRLSCTGAITCYMDGIPCPLTITGAPMPIVSDVAINCPNFDLPGYQGKLAINTDLATCTATGTITNNADAQCGDITVEVGGSTSSPGIVILKAVAICRGTKYILRNSGYEVVPDPSLSGTCTWNAEKDDKENYRTTTGNGALPSGNALSHIYGRCGAITGAGTDDSYALLTKDYGGNGMNPWPNNGITGLTEMSYDGIKPNITCTPAITPAPCPPLKVVNAPACEGKTNLATYCPSTEWSDVKWGTPVSKGTTPGCYFVNFTSLPDSKLQIETTPATPWRVNGTLVSSGGSASLATLNGNRKDGGFYIYLQSSITYIYNPGTILAALEKPFCAVGIHRLFCKVPSNEQPPISAITKPTLTCNGGTPAATAWEPNSLNWDSPADGIYDVTVSGTCDGQTADDGKCGTLTVKTPTCEGFNNSNGNVKNCGSEDGTISWGDLVTNYTISSNTLPEKKCYFVKNGGDINIQINNNGSAVTFYINGVARTIEDCSSSSKCTSGITQQDGGYYVDLTRSTFNSNYWTNFTAAEPTCP